MLLVYQIGSVKIGEVVRYTITYTPSQDRILPTPEHLHLRIRNTTPIPLRAAFVHGPGSALAAHAEIPIQIPTSPTRLRATLVMYDSGQLRTQSSGSMPSVAAISSARFRP